MTKIWQQAARFFQCPVGIALTIVRVDLNGESAKAIIDSPEHAVVFEGHTQPFSNDRIFLDPGVKEAAELLDA